MESEPVFDNVKFKKAKAIARFNRFRKITKIWQVFEVFLVFALLSWSSTRVPMVLRMSGGFMLDMSSYLLNHHVVLVIGNLIIISLFVLCRQNDAGNVAGTGDLYDDYVKHSEASKRNSASDSEPTSKPVMAKAVSLGVGRDDGERQIIVSPDLAEEDDVATAIKNASRQIQKFHRTQSEKLKSEIAVKPRRELRRSETENYRAIVSSGEKKSTAITSLDGTEIYNLSNEEFQRTIEDFIQKNWNKKLLN